MLLTQIVRLKNKTKTMKHLKKLGPQKGYKDERYIKSILLNLSKL